MGNGATRSLERVAAAMGDLGSVPIEFQAACDVAQGGVLLGLPALLAAGLLRYKSELYQLPNGYYGIESVFLLLALMALARVRSLEQLRYQAPGGWGRPLRGPGAGPPKDLRERSWTRAPGFSASTGVTPTTIP